MKTAAISGVLIAALAAGAVAIPTASSAQPYGYDRSSYGDCKSDGTAGAIIGGIAGALLGSSVAPHHGNRAGGAAIGGVAGALLGNSIARSSSNCRTVSEGYGYDSYGYSPSYSYAPSYGYSSYYSQPRYYGGYADRDYRRDHDHDWRRDRDDDYHGWRR